MKMNDITTIALISGSGLFFVWALCFSIKQCVKIRAEQERIAKRYDDRIYYSTF